MRKSKYITAVSITVVLSIFISGCSKDENDTVDGKTLIKHWDINLSALYENPAPAARTETGVASLDLYSDNSLSYHLMINNLKSGDALTASHIHFGDAVTNGPVILNFNPTFAGNMALGVVTNIRTTLMDTILNLPVYVNVHSTDVGSGLARGQMDKTINYALDVALSGANEVPAVATAATGLALLRLADDNTLYSKITVANLEPADALTMAHIHSAAAGVNGGVLQGLAAAATDFGVSKTNVLSTTTVASLKIDPVYVNVHSVNFGGGLIRGQIR